MERAMVRETMRKMKRDIAMMATILIEQVAMRNHEMRRDKGKRIKCFLCQGPHMARKCPKKIMIATIKKKDEPKEEAKPIEGKTSRVNSMVLILKERNGEEGLMFVDINIAG
ncbi:hypothetical protein Gotri_024022 [Gossypium trilobum]|uniref:Uncharacterized protein n=1 Tax=Gossypium trilobum TaxID=34281 RepID=A0A7J9DKV2_9ROSI|nr:hypothetical protein [Gossypium trilobum]